MPKSVTRDQLQSRKDKAFRFKRYALGDPERADEIAGESVEGYAERRKITLTNPNGRSTHTELVKEGSGCLREGIGTGRPVGPDEFVTTTERHLAVRKDLADEPFDHLGFAVEVSR